MAKPTGNKSAPPPKPGGNRLFTGLLAGMILGVGMAAVLAWYIVKSPTPWMQKNQPETKTPVVAEKPLQQQESSTAKLPPAPVETHSTTGKPRFDFYKVLTDKHDPVAVEPANKATSSNNKAADSVAQVLQAGSFSNVDDAEKLKAKLAMFGSEASIQTAAIPDKGVWYRVRLGPYKNAEELNRARVFLKQNGVDSTPMRAQ